MPDRARQLPQWDRLRGLAREAWTTHARVASSQAVLSPSIPLLYLGDAERYLTSPSRVLTVNLSPSPEEFPEDDPWARFPRARPLDPETAGDDELDHYLAALNGYFRTDPNAEAFDGTYEPLLNGLGVSYHVGQSIALHTYLRTSSMTTVPWDDLDAPTQTTLEEEGRPLWHRLVEVLDPHVLVLSVPHADLRRVRFDSFEPLTTAYTAEDRDPPYEVHSKLVRVNDRRVALLYGPVGTDGTPFDGLDALERRDVGDSLRARLPS